MCRPVRAPEDAEADPDVDGRRRLGVDRGPPTNTAAGRRRSRSPGLGAVRALEDAAAQSIAAAGARVDGRVLRADREFPHALDGNPRSRPATCRHHPLS